jgi:hypothetical protein
MLSLDLVIIDNLILPLCIIGNRQLDIAIGIGARNVEIAEFIMFSLAIACTQIVTE